MTYGVGTLWAIYIITVVVSFIIFVLLLGIIKKYHRSIGYGSAFFLATILGAIAVIVGTAWLNPNELNNVDKTWLSVLFLVAFLFPIFMFIYIIWNREYTFIFDNSCEKEECSKPCEKNYFKQIVHCNRDTGICQIKEKTIYEGDNITKIIYHKGKSVDVNE